jgi:hypothetical protein
LAGAELDVLRDVFLRARERLGRAAAAGPSDVAALRDRVRAVASVVEAVGGLIEHARRFERRVVAALDATDRARADTDADKPGEKRVRLPSDPDVFRLAKLINDCLDRETSRNSIALQFTGGDDKRAAALLRQLRRYPHLLKPRGR